MVVLCRGYVYDSNKARAIKLCSASSLNQCLPFGKRCVGVARAIRIKLVVPTRKKKTQYIKKRKRNNEGHS